MTATNPLSLGRKMKPTLKHRPAIWECLLGTVNAMNDAGEVKYFDYDWAGACEFAGVDESGRDPRHFRSDGSYSVGDGYDTIRKGQFVLYVRKA